MDYLKKQNKIEDPYVQHRMARIAMNVQTAHLWLRHVADLWAEGSADAAGLAGNQARLLVEELATETVDHCIRACGARCLNRPSALERVYRDLSFYVRHDNADHVLATIGRQVLGLHTDVSFFKRSMSAPANGNGGANKNGS